MPDNTKAGEKLRPLAAFAFALALSFAIGSPARARPSAAARRDSPAAALQDELNGLARQARPGTLGISIDDLATGQTWRVNAGRPYPMMSVFKAPLGATVLSEADRGKISLDQKVVIRRQDLMTAGLSQIATSFHGDHETFTVRQLLAAAVSHSDNTAADVLLQLVGGPGAVTAFLRAHGIAGIRVDRSEEEIAEQFQHPSNLHAAGAAATGATRDGRPTRRGYAAYLQDPRDRATPDAAVLFLRKLWRGKLLSPASTRHLLALLYAQTVPDRLRAGIPAGVRLADKCGTSYEVDGRTAAFNDMGILTWPDGHTVIVAAFLTDSHAPDARRDALFKTLAQTVAADLRPTPPAARYDRARSSSSRIGHSGR